MMTAQDYLDRIAAAMPRMLPERDQIVADVQAHIEERLQRSSRTNTNARSTCCRRRAWSSFVVRPGWSRLTIMHSRARPAAIAPVN
jgi:hypothetical protein